MPSVHPPLLAHDASEGRPRASKRVLIQALDGRNLGFKSSRYTSFPLVTQFHGLFSSRAFSADTFFCQVVDSPRQLIDLLALAEASYGLSNDTKTKCWPCEARDARTIHQRLFSTAVSHFTGIQQFVLGKNQGSG